LPSHRSKTAPLRRLASLLCAGAAVGLLGAPPASADDAAADQGVLADGSVRVSPVTVEGRRDDRLPARRTTTATKTDTPLRDVPQSVTVIPDEVIRDQSMQTMADLLRYVPGATMGQGEGHRDAPTIRGVSSTADFFVDGVRDDVQYFRDLYNAERVEVLKGPNAMIFGRGGGGGVINRVTKRANWTSGREVVLEAGAYDHYRGVLDLNQPFSEQAAGRLVALVQDSQSFRDFVGLERWGVNPTLAWVPTDRLAFNFSYEHFEDDRTVDRGIPSLNGAPSPAERSTFFGDPHQSYATTDVDIATATVHYVAANGLTVRNHTHWAHYDKYYQNVFAGGAVFTDAATGERRVPLAAYNNLTERENLFNQTDVTVKFATGAVRHTLLAGVELGRQTTENFRQTGTFAPGTSIVPFAEPTVLGAPITFAQSATDGDNRTTATIAAVYLQDQIEVTRWLQLIGGLRFDAFDIDYRNNRNGQELSRQDDLVSPRLGLVLKPIEPVSLYASYSISYLPSSGEQFAALNATTAALEPEEFENLELGAKWDIRPNLSLTAALYRLEQTNTTAPDPARPGVVIQTGSQRTHGFEVTLGGYLTDAWQVVGGYGWQDAEITSTTTAAPAGRKVPLVPRHTFSLWNKYQFTPMIGAGLGVIHQEEMFASISNTVTLPSFTRVDAALFVNLTETVRAQLNVENVFDETYFPTSHGDNNILPGSPRAARVSLTTRF
jgi:catecholate siderophore receptor